MLTPFAVDNLETYREYGLKAMQNARLIRLIEEADRQGAVFDQPHLCLITNITAKSIRSRLASLLEKGGRLPLAGQEGRHRGRILRSTYALKMALAGERPGVIQKELFVSTPQWESWQLDFARVAALAEKATKEDIVRITCLNPQLVEESLDLARQSPRNYLSRLQASLGISCADLSDRDPAARLKRMYPLPRVQPVSTCKASTPRACFP